MKSKVAIVILNYNGKHHLEKFLPSVVKHSATHTIIVADNNSTDDSIAFLESSYPYMRIIRNKSNGGFAQGYNDALQQVEAKYYILLNSDVEVSPLWVEPLLTFMENNSNVAGCQPKICAYNNKNKFEHAGAAGGFLDKNYYPFCRGRIFDKTENDEGQYNETKEVFWATGACMMIRSDLFHKVGGFDATFFAHMEEIDLCWRLKRLGYSFYALGESTVYHLGGGTLQYLSPKKTYLNFRNSLFMITKNHEGFLPTMIFKRLILDGLATIQFITKGQFNHIYALLKAHLSFYSKLGEMLKKRKQFKLNHTIEFNKKGQYKGSIIFARFVKRETKFSQLKEEKIY